jgi:signal transduction histidine kinase
MAVPVTLDGRLLGVLEIESLKEGAFDPRLKDVLIYFAEIMSMTQVIHEHRLHAEEREKLAEEREKLTEERAKQKELERTNGELHHRVANSLGIIMQSARELEREILPDSAHERVQYVLGHSIRINNVLLELKDLSKPRPVTVDTVDVASLVRSVFEERLPRPEDVMVKLAVGYSPVKALADEEKLRDALACVANNALEAIEERRVRDVWESDRGDEPKQKLEAEPNKYWIEVTLSEDANSVGITIADNGVGFDEEIRARLFNPLFSTKNGSENLHKGYGLYTSERVIKGMGGSIDAFSAGTYRGATFTVRLQKPKE